MSSLLAALKPAKQGLGGGDIVSLTRMATQKTLTEPDPELNGDVVAALRKGYASPEATADALRARLRQANPHKVWLAVELTRTVLTKAPEATRHVRAKVLEEVERVASSPMNRYGSDLKGQQNAKTAAFKLVSEYAGGSLLPGGGGGSNANGSASANGGSGGGGGAAAANASPAAAAAQGQRRRPKPQPAEPSSENAEAEGASSSSTAATVADPSSRKPQAIRKVVTAASRLVLLRRGQRRPTTKGLLLLLPRPFLLLLEAAGPVSSRPPRRARPRGGATSARCATLL